jgi:hypothetical protein
MQNDTSKLDQFQNAYKAAIEEWISAIKQEEALASVDHSVAEVDQWEQAHFREETRQHALFVEWCGPQTYRAVSAGRHCERLKCRCSLEAIAYRTRLQSRPHLRTPGRITESIFAHSPQKSSQLFRRVSLT